MVMKNKSDILNGPIAKQILRIFFPILIGSFFQQLYNTVDAIVVGNYVGKVALGAVGGSTGTLINLLVGFITGLSAGAAVVVAQFYGKKDDENVSKSVRTGMFLAIVSGAIIMILGFTLAPKLLTLTNVNEEMFPFALTYMRVYFLGLIPLMVYNLGAGALRACGDSKRPLYFLIASTITNIVLDILFVKNFNMGVMGAALATIISQLISALLTLYVLAKDDDSYHFVLKDLSIDINLLRQTVRIGLPTGLQSVMYSITNIVAQAIVNSFGTDTSAGNTAASKIDQLYWMYTAAMGAAIMTVVGQNFGAGNLKRVKETIRKGLILHFVGTTLVFLTIYFLCPYIIPLFSNDPAVQEIGVSIARFLSPCWLFFVCVEVFSSSIRACGDSLRPMIITMIGVCVVRLIWMTFCSKENIFIPYYCYPISWGASSLVFIIYYFSGIWLKICLKKRESLLETKVD